MILGIALLLAAVVAAWYLRRTALAAEAMRKDMAATRTQAKAALKTIQRTNGHADRILERAYHHQQEINALVEHEAVQAAIRHATRTGLSGRQR